MSLPIGTVSFLFTDIEGSTRLWEQHPDAMRLALERHDALLRVAIEANSGVVFKTVGDAFCTVFVTAPEALQAALTAQQALHSERWPEALTLKVRMALHVGAASLRDNDYFGQPLNRVARLLSAGHGGQVLLSDVAHDLTRDTLPFSTALKSLGDHRLQDLGRPENVFQLVHPSLPSLFPPLKSLDNPDLPNNLPLQLTSFIGREKEMAEVKSLLATTRLFTLTGSGGAGKTRLSLQVAAEVLEEFPEGVWLVEFAPLADPALVPQAVASLLCVVEQRGKSITQTLTEHLKAKKLLLVLDNCEHLLSACAQLTDSLLRSCPGVKILASSREGLGIAGETVYRMPSLSLPDLKQAATPASLTVYEAVRLFVDRALAALPAFAVTQANAPALASVCHRLDGIPLAIELAAARVRSLSVEEINNKLDNRFRLLTGGSKTALPRQQTLAAAIDWSYDLLNGQEKLLLARLSVFAGGWTLEAAEVVGAGKSLESRESIEDWETLDLLTSLVDKSLVLAEIQADRTRYRLLETVRQYALDRLVQSRESHTVRARHRGFFLGLAEEVRPKLRGPEQAQWLAVLEEEHDNLRQALRFCREDTGGEDAGQGGLFLGAALQYFWLIRGHLTEGREHLSALLSQAVGQKPTMAYSDALHGTGVLAFMQGDFTAARALLEESLALRRNGGDRLGLATSLNSLGVVAHGQGDYGSARSLSEESLTIMRALGDRWGIAYAVFNLGRVACERVDYGSARSLSEESLTIMRELGDKWGIAYSLLTLGRVACEQGNCVSAHSLTQESLAIMRELGDKRGIAYALSNLGIVAREHGDYASSHARWEESLAIMCELGDKRGIAASFEAFASLAIQEGREERSARLWGAAAVLRESFGSPLLPGEQERWEREAAVVRKKLSEAAFVAAQTEGRALTLEQAVSYALRETSE